MHVAVMFINIGGYHAARLRAAHAACRARGWRFTALQVTDWTFQHPWGDLPDRHPFPLETLLPRARISETAAEQAMRSAPREEIDAWLNRVRPTVLALPGWGFPVARTALRWCKAHGVQRIVMSETKQDDEPRRWWKEFLKALLYVRQFDAAMVSGPRQREYLAQLGFPRERIYVGYSAVDNDYFASSADAARADASAARARWLQIPRRPYFLSVTRLLPQKNVDTLVRGYAAYRQGSAPDSEPWDLVVCGSGASESSIRAQVRELGLEQSVHLPGFSPYASLGAWYGLAGAFVHPAVNEPWGLVVNEACAAGLPIICSTSVGAFSALLTEGVNGFAFEPRDPNGLARAMLAIDHSGTAGRSAMGQASRQLVASFGIERFADALAAAVEAAAARRAGQERPLPFSHG